MSQDSRENFYVKTQISIGRGGGREREEREPFRKRYFEGWIKKR